MNWSKNSDKSSSDLVSSHQYDFMYIELGRLNKRYRYLSEHEYRRIERYRRYVHDEFQININEGINA